MRQSHPFDQLIQISEKYENLQINDEGSEYAKPSWMGLLFIAAEHEWLVPLSELNEIVAVTEITPVPNVKQWLKGLINLRGNLVSVIDLGHFLTNKKTVPSKHNRIIACYHEGEWVGILIEQVKALHRVHNEDIKPITENNALFEKLHVAVEGAPYANQLVPIINLKELIVHPDFKRISALDKGIIG